MTDIPKRVLLRQGDVLLDPLDELPRDARGPEATHRIVVERGEATGHAHVLVGESAERWSGKWGRPLFVVNDTGPATLTHPEHDPIAVPPGVYTIRRQREFGARGWGALD